MTSNEIRILWTSGTDEVDAMNQVGRTRPWCGEAAVARQYAGEGETLYRITVEAFPSRTALRDRIRDTIGESFSTDEAVENLIALFADFLRDPGAVEAVEVALRGTDNSNATDTAQRALAIVRALVTDPHGIPNDLTKETDDER